MGQQIPNTSQVSIASVMATALTVTAASNAAAAVLTVTNTYSVGDFVEYTSGWSRATNRVYRLSAVSGTTATLEGLDTTSVVNFPAGGGVGTVRKVTTWTQVLQILEPAFGGGEAQTGTFKYLENEAETEFVTGASAKAFEFRIGDDITLPGYIAYKAAADAKLQVPMRIVLPNGGLILFSGKPFLNQNPSMSLDEIMSVSARVPLSGDVVRY